MNHLINHQVGVQSNQGNQSMHEKRERNIKIVGWTVLTSYLLAKAADNDITSRARTGLYIANGLANLYILELLGPSF